MLIVTCIAMTVLLGFAALGVDLGRMYVIQTELQAFTDAAAVSAAMELDGTSPESNALDRRRPSWRTVRTR